MASIKTGSINPLLITDLLFRKNARVEKFTQLSSKEKIVALRSLTKSVKKDLLTRIPAEDAAKLIESLEPDDATDVLQLLKPHQRETVLKLVSSDLRESLARLLEFDADTAAGLMTLDYIQVEPTFVVADVAEKFRQHEKKTGRAPAIVVVQDNTVKGMLPAHELGFASKDQKITDLIHRLPTISYAASHTEVVRLFNAHPHSKVAVLNGEKNIIGIIYSDDVLQLLNSNTASSLYDFAGIKDEESVTDPASVKIRNRYRWLIINLGTAFLAAFAIGLFEDTLQQYVLLAIYMPIVAGMGGNAATQTLAVQVRGISLGQIELRSAWRTLRSEMGAALANGVINGILVAIIVYILNRDVPIAGILAVAMILNLLVASFFGTLVPLVMAKLGKDPAASATIFITTATDVLGFLGFLGLAKVVLN